MIEGTALVAAGRVKERGFVYVGMAATNLILGYLLSGSFGAVGACLAICVAYCVRTAGMCVLYRRFLGFRFARFSLDTYAGWLVPSVITLAVGVAMSRLLPLGGWAGFALEALVETTVYCLACWFFFMSKSERRQLAQMLHSVVSKG